MISAPATAHEALQRTASTFGDRRGIRYFATLDAEEYRSYADLDRRARAIAQALMQRGDTVGQSAVIALRPGLAWVDAVFGILYAGMAFVPTPVGGYDKGAALVQRVGGIVRASEATVIITDRAVLDALGDDAANLGAPTVVLEDLLTDGDADAWAAPPISGDDVAFLFFTSGSTGDPKGSIGTHTGLVATAASTIDLMDLDSDATIVGWLPLHHAMGLMLQVISPAVNGSQVVLTTTEQFQRRPLSWLQLMSDHRATVSIAGNFAFDLCTKLASDAQVAELDLSSVRCFATGSEPVRPETVDAFAARFAPTGLSADTITPAYGMTEAMLITGKPLDTGLVVSHVDSARLALGTVVPSGGDDTTRLISCGRPTDVTDVVIVDPDRLTVAPEGAVGEIWISSPTVSPGYFRRPDATADAFGFTLPGDVRPYFRSGDLGAILDGELYITGRLKEVIIVRGRNLYPQDIEAAATALSPALNIAAAFESDVANTPIALVLDFDESALDEIDDPSQHTPDALAVRVRDEIVERFSVSGVDVTMAPPGTVLRTPTGKVRRKPTAALLADGAIPALESTVTAH